jgi:hypothetical protein
MDAQVKNKVKLAIDAGMLVGFLIAMEPHWTGESLHEWLTTIAGTVILITHLLLNWSWIAGITRKFLGKATKAARINYILNWLLFIDGVLIMFSGFMISKTVLPAIGIRLSSGFLWRTVHQQTADIFVFILGLHLALHWKWMVNCITRYIVQPIARLWSKRSTEQQEVQA